MFVQKTRPQITQQILNLLVDPRLPAGGREEHVARLGSVHGDRWVHEYANQCKPRTKSNVSALQASAVLRTLKTSR